LEKKVVQPVNHTEPLSKIVPPKNTWTPIDEALYGPRDLYRVEIEKANSLRLKAIRYLCNYHYEHNRFYHTLCKSRDFSPNEVKTLDDLFQIPLVPDNIFKGYPEPEKFVAWLRGISSDQVKYPSVKGTSYDEVMEKLQETGITVCYSSGTSGRFTFVPRERDSWNRLSYITIKSMDIYPPSYKPYRYYIALAPNPLKTHLFYARSAAIMCSPEFGFDPNRVYWALKGDITTDLVKMLWSRRIQGSEEELRVLARKISREDERIDSEVIQLMESLQEEETDASITGTPHWILRIISKIENMDKTFHLGDRWYVETAGGWKIGENMRISEEAFREKVERVLGVPDENIRDGYGMVECGVYFPSCEGHYKHVPYTVLEPFVLDSNLEPIGFGETGRFAFLDATTVTYPGFVITGDKVKLQANCPVCDRLGPVIEMDITRMAGVEDRGCANVMRILMEEEAMTQS
jgi:hypothetical protein